jgi:hypothetical protein
MEVCMKHIAVAGMLLALFASGLGAQDAEKPKVLKGIVEFDPKLEGGVWTMKVDGKVYDLHGDLSACASGKQVEIEGQARPGRACFHMVGTVFSVTSVKVLEEQEKRTPGRRSDERP